MLEQGSAARQQRTHLLGRQPCWLSGDCGLSQWKKNRQRTILLSVQVWMMSTDIFVGTSLNCLGFCTECQRWKCPTATLSRQPNGFIKVLEMAYLVKPFTQKYLNSRLGSFRLLTSSFLASASTQYDLYFYHFLFVFVPLLGIVSVW